MPQKISRLMITAGLVSLACRWASAEVLDKAKSVGCVMAHYKLILPKVYDARKAYPAVLAFPGGTQNGSIVQ
jgi:hypothetical protein